MFPANTVVVSGADFPATGNGPCRFLSCLWLGTGKGGVEQGLVNGLSGGCSESVSSLCC